MSNELNIDEALLFEVCHRFLANESPATIATWLNAQVEPHVTREAIYPLIRRAKREGFFRLVSPKHLTLNRRISDYYRTTPDRVHVSNVRGDLAREYVSDRAAHGVVALIEDIVKKNKKKRVRLGLGGGGTVREVAKNIAFLLKNESFVKRLGIHTLTGGLDPTIPLYAPNSFLSFFEGVVEDIEYTGLFTPPLLAAEDYKKVVESPRIAESFKWAPEIDIVITSLARADDEHGDLNRLMDLGVEREEGCNEGHNETVAALKQKEWVGDAMYRPFSPTEPITGDHGARAVSLFELEDLVEMAKQPDKHVVLVVTPCQRCNKPKNTALAPLLLEERLRIWNHLYLDMATAEALLPGAE